MGAKFFKVGTSGQLRKCSERRSDSCDPLETDGCCAVIPCDYCLEFETYDGIQYGTASFSSSGWAGTIAGAAFFGFWERGYPYAVLPERVGNSIGMGFRLSQRGLATMGSPVTEPGRDSDEVEELQESFVHTRFLIGDSPVTQNQYLKVMGTNPSQFQPNGEMRPVEMVTLFNAMSFCAKLTALPAEQAAGRSYRLPDEAEWEYACRAGTTTHDTFLVPTSLAYTFGNDAYGPDPNNLDRHAHFIDNSIGRTQNVKNKAVNAWDISDMHGNVWEWANSVRIDTPPDADHDYNIARGGAWDSPAADCRSASRQLFDIDAGRNNLGFRVICKIAPTFLDGECYFKVNLDGEEVYAKTCPEGQSCRDSSDEAEVIIDYEAGTLRWIKQEYRPLEYRIDDVTGCKTYFCGDCECTCECLCATVKDSTGLTIATGEICDTAYPCDGPIWAGTIGGYEISLALAHDIYGECVIVPTIDGIEGSGILVAGCKTISATIELDGYDTLEVVCKLCSCDTTIEAVCCPSRNCPYGSGDNPLPNTLTLELTASFPVPGAVSPSGSGCSVPESSDCFNLTFPLFLSVCENGQIVYAGVGEKNCTWCSRSFTTRISATLTCGASGEGGWYLSFELLSPPGDCPTDDTYFISGMGQDSCDPILLSGDMEKCVECANMVCTICSIVLPGPIIVPVLATHAAFCLSALIYESP